MIRNCCSWVQSLDWFGMIRPTRMPAIAPGQRWRHSHASSVPSRFPCTHPMHARRSRHHHLRQRTGHQGLRIEQDATASMSAANREAFLADEDATARDLVSSLQQREAIRARNVMQLIAAGGNAYYLARFAGIFKLDMPGHRCSADRHDRTNSGRSCGRRAQLVIAGAACRRTLFSKRTKPSVASRSSVASPPPDVPTIGGAIAKGLQRDPYWKPFFTASSCGAPMARQGRPDVAVVIWPRAELLLPMQPSRRPQRGRGWGFRTVEPFQGAVDLSVA